MQLLSDYSKLKQYFNVKLGGMVIPEVPFPQFTNLATVIKGYVCTYLYIHLHTFIHILTCMGMYD